jgi:hypothetical protein
MKLGDWLNLRIFPFEAKMCKEDIYNGSMLAFAEMLRFGVVSLTDMYFMGENIALAAIEAGIKCNLSIGTTCFDKRGYYELPVHDENNYLIKTYHNACDGRIKIDLSLHAEYTSTQKVVSQLADFAKDKKALDINDQYMFGKSLLVSPVTKPMYSKARIDGKDTVNVEDFSAIKNKEVYLPAGTDWFDFWTGEKSSGGNKVTKQTPLDIVPLYVKAGSIIPIGPSVQYAEEKKWDNLEIRIYPGANGKFVLYEDENDNYNYEKG